MAVMALGQPAVEGEVGDGFGQFFDAEPVVQGDAEVVVELLAAVEGSQRGHGDQAPVTRGQAGTVPDVSEEDVVGDLYELGGDGLEFFGCGLLGHSGSPWAATPGGAGGNVRLLGGVAAVDGEEDADDEAGAGTARPQDGGLGHLLGGAEASDGLVGFGFGAIEFSLAIMSLTMGVSMVPDRGNLRQRRPDPHQ